MYYIKRSEYFGGTAPGCEPCDVSSDPPCVCLCSLEEVRQLVCHSAVREKLWMGLEAFLVRAQAARHFSHLNLAGAIVSSVARPREIETYLQPRAPYGAAAFEAMTPLLEVGLDEIRRRYRVRLRFWIDGVPAGLRGFRGAVVAEPPREGIVRVPLVGGP